MLGLLEEITILLVRILFPKVRRGDVYGCGKQAFLFLREFMEGELTKY